MAEKNILFKVEVDTSQAIKNLSQYKKTVADIDEQIKNLRKKMKEEGADTKTLGQEIARLTEQKKAYNKEISNTSREVQNNLVATSEKYTNTLKGMRAALSAAKDELAGLALGSAEYEAQSAKVSKLNDEVKELEQEYGVFTRSVGDYENAIKNALDATNPFVVSVADLATTSGGATTMLNNVGGAIKNVGKQALALLANPVFLVIAGTAAIIMGIVKAIKSSEEQTSRLNVILAPLKRALEAVLNVMQRAAGAILSAFEMAGAAIGWVMDKMEGLPIVGKYVEAINDANKEAIELEKAKYDLAKQTRQDEIDNAKNALEVAKLRTQAKDKEKFTAAERLAMIQKAAKIEEEAAQRNMEREKEKLRIMEVEASWAENSAEVNDALAQQQASVYRAEMEYYNKTRELLEQENTARNEMAADIKAANEQIYNQQLKQLTLYQQLLKSKSEYDAIYFYDYSQSAEANAELQWKHEQEWAARSMMLAQQQAEQKLALDLKYGKITQQEYNAQQQLLQDQAAQFQLQQLADLEAHQRELLDSMIALAGGQSTQGLLESLEEQYRIAFETLKNDATLSAEERAYYEIALTDEYTKKREQIIKDSEKRIEDIKKQAYDKRVEEMNKELQLAWESAQSQYDIKREFIERELQDATLSAEKRAQLEQQLSELTSQYQMQKISAYEDFSNQVLTLATSINDTFNAIGDAQVQRAEENNNKEKESLKKQLDDGLISQKKYDKEVAKLDEELAAKKAKIARDQAIRDKALNVAQIAMNTAAAIMKIWAEVPKFDFGISTTALTAMAAATGAAQIAAVLATPIPEARTGGLVVGATHENGGVLMNLENEEHIIGAKPSKAFPELLNLISYIGKHSGIPDTGFAARSLISSSSSTSAANIDADALAQKIGEQVGDVIRETPMYLSLVELREAQERLARIEESARM